MHITFYMLHFLDWIVSCKNTSIFNVVVLISFPIFPPNQWHLRIIEMKRSGISRGKFFHISSIFNFPY